MCNSGPGQLDPPLHHNIIIIHGLVHSSLVQFSLVQCVPGQAVVRQSPVISHYHEEGIASWVWELTFHTEVERGPALSIHLHHMYDHSGFYSLIYCNSDNLEPEGATPIWTQVLGSPKVKGTSYNKPSLIHFENKWQRHTYFGFSPLFICSINHIWQRRLYDHF